MLEFILDRHVIYVLMGMGAFVGVAAKVVVGRTLRKLVAAAESMGKSSHPLMRLVRAKFEHTCMISEKVENVGVFVDKYLYEYRVAGVRFHTWQRLQMAGAGFCLILGGVGAAISYRVKGATEQTAMIGGTGAALALIVFLVHMLTDEEYRLDGVRNYMVDYLENIYQHRYEKNNKKGLRTEEETIEKEEAEREIVKREAAEREAVKAVTEQPGTMNPVKQEFESPEPDSLIWAMYKTEPLQVEDERKVTAPSTLKTAEKNIEKQKEMLEKTQQKRGKLEASQKPETPEKQQEAGERKAQDEAGRNQRIREILEEFMA